MWYICRHMWYEKLYLTFDCKVVKFHRWTPCKCNFCSHRAKTWSKLVIFALNGIFGNETSWTKGFLAITTFLIFWTPCISLLIFEKYHFRKIRGHFFISSPIFNIKVSKERSYQCGLKCVILLKIGGFVHKILMKTCFVRK